MSRAWMVRAGRGGYVVDDFEASGCIALGWSELPDLNDVRSRDELRSLVENAYPGKRRGQTLSVVSQVGRFVFDIQVGDSVLTYDSEKREYLVGEVAGNYRYDTDLVRDHPHTRTVKWSGRIGRDDLSVAVRNTLGAIQTLFALNDSVWQEVDALARGEATRHEGDADEEDLDTVRRDQVERAHEFIKDRVQKLDWQSMQELVAGVLRAMGYKTVVSAKGSDRGKDILASPDGLGLEQPRIRSEIKHKPKERIGAPQIRSFIGALRPNDKGLYVSTGGFSKEAHYEDERSNVPVTLLDLDRLVDLLVQHYEKVDLDTRALVPLVRVYWPGD